MIIAIVLAAGESTRMKSDKSGNQLKQLLPFGNKTILASVLQTLLYSKVDKFVVVLGYQANQIKKEIKKHKKIELVQNKYYKLGMLSSIKCGVRNAHKLFQKKPRSNKPDGILICLGDQPFIHPKIIAKLLAKFYKSPYGIFIPVYRKKRGHPILIRAAYCNEILRIPLEKGLRYLIQTYSSDILEIPVRSSLILKDIDTPEEYQKAVRKYGKKR